jgi:broad specificity phosphatase PhoE
MVELILVRHGETDWNTEKIFRGRANVALNDVGRRQAALLGDCLSGEKIDAVYAGPLQRAVRTASVIATPHRLEVKIVESLNDLDCGEWQGLTTAQVRQKFPALYRDWLEKPERVRLPGGETLAAVRERVMPLAQELVKNYEEGRVVLVSHRLVHKVLICALLGLENSFIWNFQLDTGGITRFSYDGARAVLIAHNDTGHLKAVRAGRPVDF